MVVYLCDSLSSLQKYHMITQGVQAESTVQLHYDTFPHSTTAKAKAKLGE